MAMAAPASTLLKRVPRAFRLLAGGSVVLCCGAVVEEHFATGSLPREWEARTIEDYYGQRKLTTGSRCLQVSAELGPLLARVLLDHWSHEGA